VPAKTQKLCGCFAETRVVCTQAEEELFERVLNSREVGGRGGIHISLPALQREGKKKKSPEFRKTIEGKN